MDVKKNILNFMSNRPDVVGIIGYGSGINPQKGQEKRKPQIDLIVIVDDLKKWHKENIKLNKKDYSLLSILFFKLAPVKLLKAGAKICYMTYIPYNGNEYKIGTIELKDFLNDLTNWETFYLAGRMQKPILIVKANKEIEKAIDNNRKMAVKVTKKLLNKKVTNQDFYIKLTSLSYIGDTRMKIAENPDKVKNIVLGSLDFYDNNYSKLIKSISVDDNLPKELNNYLKNDNNIEEFFQEKNKSQSLSQTIKGIFTTGIIKSVKYASAKLKRAKGR